MMKLTPDLLNLFWNLNEPLYRIDFSKHVYECLDRYNLRSLVDVVALYPRGIADIRGIGRKGMKEIQHVLRCFDIDTDYLEEQGGMKIE